MKERLSRREFFQLAGIGVLAGSSLSYLKAKQIPELVVVEGEMLSATRKAISALGGMKRFVKPGAKVLIKPNLSFASGPERGANTHPEMVAEVARLCLEAGAKEVLIADHPLYPATLCLWRSGIRETLKKIPKARFQYFTEEKFYQEVKVPRGKDLKKVKILKPALEADLIINLAKAKTHGDTTVTLCLKNLMGFILNRKRFHTIYNLHQAIADLSSVIQPGLNLIDASTVMTEGGPGGPGILKKLNLVVAGTNQVETDALMVTLSKWYGRSWKPAEIKHLKLASELGLGEIAPEKLKYQRIKV